MLGTCVITFVLMFLPKSRQLTAMGREGFFLEVSLTLSYTVQLLMFLPKSLQLTAMGREGFFLEVSLTLSYTV